MPKLDKIVAHQINEQLSEIIEYLEDTSVCLADYGFSESNTDLALKQLEELQEKLEESLG